MPDPMTTLPASAAPTTEAGRWVSLLLAEADIRWPDEHTRIAASVIDGWLAGIEAQARADALADVRAALMAGHPGRGENHRYCGPYPDDCLSINETLDRLATATQSSDDAGEEE